ncbi:M20/M25/M40 family metallo-hydrolase [Streptomyces fragilis]|uniref:M20/M25/M40 family metallo-hydrolase n=1 Tax=Streptomyces fragilis TaxID=67301 RepID=A0ABV2YGK4_9ACTN|nr:M20/M25/M40 family metallo-hydrolase [Streptomyces fragilis]
MALLLAVVLAALLPVFHLERTPAPAPADASATAFSATRAQEHVERIASAPRPVGSAAHARVRDNLLRELRELGLKPVVHRGVGFDTTSGAAMAAPVENIEATLPGADPTGRVLLVAHYDSVETGPGATDDGHGVASLLEIARALRAGPAPRNDVTLLLTDGEELGMIGAHAYTDAGRLGDADRTVVLNLEGRGSAGRVVMFETGAHSAGLVPALTDRVPVTTSLAYEVYRLLPNNTDFSVFREAGATGMNFATVDGSANYDNPTDDLAHASEASLQDMGDTALAATRRLGAADIPAIRKADAATYFTLGGTLVRYPAGLVLPLAAGALAACAAATLFAARRRRVRVRAVLTGAATVPVPLLAAAAVGWAGWHLLGLLRPDLTGFSFGDSYRSELTATGLAALTAAAVWTWAAVVRRRRGALELGAAVTLWLTLLTLLTAVFLPGASYLFLWPALTGAAGLALGARLPEESPWRGPCSALAAVPAAALLAPVALLLFRTVGLALVLVPLVLLALLALTAVAPFTGRARGRSLALRAGLASLVAVAVTAAGAVRDGVDARHPAQVSLLYTVDDGGRARWVSSGRGAHEWADAHVPDGPRVLEDEFPELRDPVEWRTGTAPAATVATPTLKVLGTRRIGDDREVTMVLGATGGTATQLMLYADTRSATVEGATVGGRTLPGGDNRISADGRWTWGFLHAAPPAEGVRLTLRISGDGPLALRLLARSPGFPAGTLAGDKPRTVTWAARSSGYTLAAKAFTI